MLRKLQSRTIGKGCRRNRIAARFSPSLEPLEQRNLLAFTPGNLAVLRIGDGFETLSNESTELFIDEYQTDGTFVQSIALPTSGASALTGRGDGFTEGGLNRTVDGQYLILPGYRKDMDLSNPEADSAALTNRVIGRIDAAGNINTTTALGDAFNNIAVRGVASPDGNQFWISGAPGTTGGIRYVASLGATTSTDLKANGTDNMRQAQIIDGQLYVSSGAFAPGKTIWKVGNGLPTSGAQTYTATIPAQDLSQYNAFFTADLSTSVAGFDTIYAISSLQNASALEKWTFDGTTWTKENEIQWPSPPSPAPSAFGLTGMVQGSTVSLFVTSANTAGGGDLLSLVDTSGYDASINGSFNIIASAAFDTSFRHLVFVPSAAPVITTSGGSVTHTEGGAATVVDSGLTITDADSATLSSAKVVITGNFEATDVLSFTPSGGITGSYSNGILTLSGSASAAAYQTVLRSVTLSTTSDNPSAAARTVSFSALDNSVVPSNVGTRTVNVTPVNDAPVITKPGTQIVGLSHALFFSTINGNPISLADVDVQSGTMTLTLSVTAGTVTLSQLTGLTGSGNGTASLSYTGTLADLNAALQNAFFFSPASPQSVTMSIGINDLGNTGTGGAQTDSETLMITVTNVANSAPVVTTTGSALSYTENATTAVDSGLTVVDSDHANLVGATVAITGNYNSTQDVLAFVNQLGITGSWSTLTGVLTLTGSSSVANYQTALRSVTYTNTSDSPNTATRTVSFVATDGVDPSTAATRNITIGAVNDDPVNVAPGQQVVEKNVAKVFNAANSNLISFSDVDAGGANVQVTLTSAGGTLTLSTLAGLTGSGNGTGSLTYTGTIAALNAALNGLTFQPTLNLTGSTSIAFTSNDLGNTGSGGPKSAVSNIPILIIDPAPLVINEIYFRPPVSSAVSQYVELRSTLGGNYVIPSGTYLIGVEGNGTINTGEIHDIFNLSGMVTGPNGHLVILPSSNLYTSPTDITDPSGTVLQQGPLAPGFGNLNMVFGSTVGHYGSTGFTSIESANSLTFFLVQTPTLPLVNEDIDANDDGFTDGNKFPNWVVLDSVGYGNFQTGTNYVYGEINYLDTTGTAIAQTGLSVPVEFSARYFGRAGNTTGSTPSDWVAAGVNGENPSWTLSELFSSQPGYAGLPLDHIGGPNFPGIDQKPVVDLDPALGGRDSFASWKQGGGAVLVPSAVATVTDPNSANLTSLTVTITNLLNGANEILAANTAGTSISASYLSGVLTLSGSDTLANYQKVLRTVTYNNTAGSPDLTTRVLNVVASDGVNSSLLSVAQVGLFSNTYSALINEIDLTPPGSENPYEYIELRGTPGSNLNNVYLVQFDGRFFFGLPGDPGYGRTGTAHMVVDLTGQVFGASGLLVVKSPTGGFTIPGGTTVVTDPQLDTIGGGLLNGSTTFMLIHSTTPISEGFDYDSVDNGVLNLLPSGSEVIDSVGWRHHVDDYDIPYGVVQLTQFEGAPNAATRFVTNLTHTKPAWYNGWLDITGANPAQLNYDPPSVSSNFPSGGMLTPGAANVPNYASSVVGRRIFYNQSKFDGNGTGISASDDLAIATDKSAYLPGSGAATFSNITSYTRGINGIIVDIAGTHGTLTASDFTFKMSLQTGANNTPSTWAAAPAPVSFSVRAGAGVSGSDRVEVVWANGAIANRWLEVIVEGNDVVGGFNTNTGLGASDRFYFGNRIGDTGTGTPTLAVTSALDELAARNNPGAGATVTNLFDFDRSGLVTAVDSLASRNNAGTLTKINLTNPPAAPDAGGDASGAIAFALAVPGEIDVAEAGLPSGSWTSDLATAAVASAAPQLVEASSLGALALAVADDALVGLDDELLDSILADLGG